ILGFPFFKPLFESDTEILLYGFPRWQGDTHKLLLNVFCAPHFPVPPRALKARIRYVECSGTVTLPGISVQAVPLSHPNVGVGYSFKEKNKRFVFLTDNELGYRHRGGLDRAGYSEFCTKASLLVHDSEYMEEDYARTWGHSKFTDAVRLAADAGVERLGLFHHSQDRVDEEILRMQDLARERLAGLGSEAGCFAVYQDQEIRL
ncbi:MAG: MBL fold metallo-hydrolase, partial [Desulfonatronovibrionaceae bacterium]